MRFLFIFFAIFFSLGKADLVFAQAKKDTSLVTRHIIISARDAMRQKNIDTVKSDTGLIMANILAADSIKKRQQFVADSAQHARQLDSLALVQAKQAQLAYEVWLNNLVVKNKFFKNADHPFAEPDIIHPYHSNEYLFYLIAGLFLLLGIIRISFYKYFSDVFRAFFNPTLSNRQLKDQLLQTPFPSLLLNMFFCISAGIYLFLLLRLFKFIVLYKIAIVIAALTITIAIIYLVKYLMIRISGWLFGSSEVAEAYIFILFLINKIIGIVLLPFILILAFCNTPIAQAGYYISLAVIIIMLGYRYIRSYGLVRKYISFNRFHFFLYLCAFEIAPVLIVAKVVLIWLNGNT